MSSSSKLHDVGRPNPNSHYAPDSVLRNLDLSDINGVKDVMFCVHQHATVPYFHMLATRAKDMKTLSKANYAVLRRLLRLTQTTVEREQDLLLLALCRWALAYDKSPKVVQKANQELIDLAPAEVLFHPASFPGLYREAKLKFEKRESAIAAADIAAPVVAAPVVAAPVVVDEDSDSDSSSLSAGPAYAGKAKGVAKKSEPAVVPTTGGKMASKSGVKKQVGVNKSGVRIKSCTNCRDGHISCDKAQPKCKHCVKKGLRCVYERFAGKGSWNKNNIKN